MRFLLFLVQAVLIGAVSCLDLRRLSFSHHPDAERRSEVQRIITWDEKSLFVNGERVALFSGEIHPFRLPVPSLWLDLFQKLKAAGFNCVSFYTDWALHEGKRGQYTADGIFALEPFFDAAKQAGMYLIARPGPYINAEVSGGGFPGWLQRVPSPFRASNPEYLEATDNYMKNMATTIAKAQITNGGPVILFQPENEYTLVRNGQLFPDGKYMQYVIDQARDAGIVVPVISNDAHPQGHNAPGTGAGEVDIYGHDAYPLGFNCARPDEWPAGKLPTNWWDLHMRQSPATPYALLEFQGGSFDPWGGNGYEMCAELLNHEFTRVFNKNNIASGIKILNHYMTFGGTNWGNLGYPRGYTSYDYSAAIAEDRTITRKKYSEVKLIGYFFASAPAYMESVPGRATTALTNTKDLTVTPLVANETAFWVVRHTDYTQRQRTDYKITLPTRQGNITIPQLGGQLTLNGRDSKILITDLLLSDDTYLRYSSAEILASTEMIGQQVLVLYGRDGESHECAIDFPDNTKNHKLQEGSESTVKAQRQNNSLVVAWDASKDRSIVDIGSTRLVLLGRDAAYDYWVVDLKGSPKNQKVIIQGPYLVRNARVRGNGLYISADFNQTTTVEVLGVPSSVKKLYINNQKFHHSEGVQGIWSAKVEFKAPTIRLPDFSASDWRYIDSLPEVNSRYDDSAWPKADLKESHNDYRKLSTPTSLYSGDYGFHSGLLIYRGHFTALGNETGLDIWTQGGWASSSSVWLDGTYLGTSKVNSTRPDANTTYNLPSLDAGASYVLTVLQDNQGYELNPWVGDDEMKYPRGILNYTLHGRNQDAIAWKVTGNLGGEDYVDHVRGPSNEGGSFVERNGFHQPRPPTYAKGWGKRSPIAQGLSRPGIGYFATSFDLSIPKGWDVPLAFSFANQTAPAPAYRAQLFVNGYNFGRYINNVGPQKSFHVPEGILNYQGRNWVGITIWGQEKDGVKLDDFKLGYEMPVLSSMESVRPVPQPKWKSRKNAY